MQGICLAIWIHFCLANRNGRVMILAMTCNRSHLGLVNFNKNKGHKEQFNYNILCKIAESKN